MSITRRYVHPQAETIRAAMEEPGVYTNFNTVTFENDGLEKTETKPVIV